MTMRSSRVRLRSTWSLSTFWRNFRRSQAKVSARWVEVAARSTNSDNVKVGSLFQRTLSIDMRSSQSKESNKLKARSTSMILTRYRGEMDSTGSKAYDRRDVQCTMPRTAQKSTQLVRDPVWLHILPFPLQKHFGAQPPVLNKPFWTQQALPDHYVNNYDIYRKILFRFWCCSWICSGICFTANVNGTTGFLVVVGGTLYQHEKDMCCARSLCLMEKVRKYSFTSSLQNEEEETLLFRLFYHEIYWKADQTTFQGYFQQMFSAWNHG